MLKFNIDLIIWGIVGIIALLTLLYNIAEEYDKEKFINHLSDNEIRDLYNYSIKNYSNKDFDNDKFDLIRKEYNKRKKN